MNRCDCEWIPLFETIANAVDRYKNDRAQLIDALGDALAACAMQFPIVESGEDFDDICPFTFFASFTRSLPDSRRKRLLECLRKELRFEGGSEMQGQPAPIPCAFPGLHSIDERSLRFFGHDPNRSPAEVDALWNLFSLALRYADERTPETQTAFVSAYDRVMALRISGRYAIPTALSWIRPDCFLPLTCMENADGSQAASSTKNGVITGSAYIELLDRARQPSDVPGHGKGAPPSVFSVTLEAWNGQRRPDPRLDRAKTQSLLDEYGKNIEAIRAKTQGKWSAVRTFQEQWNPDTDDFSIMLEKALAGYNALVPHNPTFDPHKDILVFARNDPEKTRAAFGALFDIEIPTVERVLTFESATAALFERHRGDIVRAIPRRSSHGNFYAICAYVFLNFPDTTYLFSPNRVRALNALTETASDCRIADPSAIEHYHRLCEQVLAFACEDEALLAADKAIKNTTNDYADNAHHVLVEDIIDYAANRRGGRLPDLVSRPMRTG